jgi:5'-nucleotidase/UDP-sugar diphosphatase
MHRSNFTTASTIVSVMKSRCEVRGARRGARPFGSGILWAFVAACLLILPLPARAQGTVTILHLNDVYEITPVEAGRAGGLARVARLRAEMKSRDPSLLTTLGGDYLSPSALGTARVNGERLNGKQMVAVLNVAGIEWGTFGNHEFDIPEAALRARLAESKFKLVASNVTDAGGALFPNTVSTAVIPVKTRSGVVRVGLIGLTIDANKQSWVRYGEPISAAKAAIAEIQGQFDVLVAITHLALAGDQQLAEEVPAIDVILGGHEHENWVLERGEHFTPIVKADANVRTVAIVTIDVPRKGSRPVISARMRRIDDAMKDGPKTAAEVKKWVDLGFAAFRADGFEPNNVVTRIDTPLYGREAMVRNGPTTLTVLICDAMRHDSGTPIAVFNSGSIRIDDVVPPGPVTEYDVIRVLPFGGKMVKATFTGALLSRILQVGDQNRGTGGYLQSAGVPAAIDPAGRYTLTISDFLLTGQEANLGFLTRQNPDISDITDLRDIRLAVIDELKRRFAPK